MVKIIMGQRAITSETIGWLLRERDCKQGHDFERFCAEVLKVRLTRNGKPSHVYDLTGTELDEWRGVDACVDDVRVDWTLRGDNKSFTEWVVLFSGRTLLKLILLFLNIPPDCFF